MATCNETCKRCPKGCERQEMHGGDCDCRNHATLPMPSAPIEVRPPPVSPVSADEANELRDILRTLTPSGTALITSARELVNLMEQHKRQYEVANKWWHKHEREVNRLEEEVHKLHTAIRKHRDSSGHDLCWYQPELWSLLPEGTGKLPQVPPKEEFLRRCSEYRKSLDGSTADGNTAPVGESSKPIVSTLVDGHFVMVYVNNDYLCTADAEGNAASELARTIEFRAARALGLPVSAPAPTPVALCDSCKHPRTAHVGFLGACKHSLDSEFCSCQGLVVSPSADTEALLDRAASITPPEDTEEWAANLARDLAAAPEPYQAIKVPDNEEMPVGSESDHARRVPRWECVIESCSCTYAHHGKASCDKCLHSQLPRDTNAPTYTDLVAKLAATEKERDAALAKVRQHNKSFAGHVYIKNEEWAAKCEAVRTAETALSAAESKAESELGAIRRTLIDECNREYAKTLASEKVVETMKSEIEKLVKQAIEVCWAIEACGASLELTAAVVKAGELHSALKALAETKPPVVGVGDDDPMKCECATWALTGAVDGGRFGVDIEAELKKHHLLCAKRLKAGRLDNKSPYVLGGWGNCEPCYAEACVENGSCLGHGNWTTVGPGTHYAKVAALAAALPVDEDADRRASQLLAANRKPATKPLPTKKFSTSTEELTGRIKLLEESDNRHAHSIRMLQTDATNHEVEIAKIRESVRDLGMAIIGCTHDSTSRIPPTKLVKGVLARHADSDPAKDEPENTGA